MGRSIGGAVMWVVPQAELRLTGWKGSATAIRWRGGLFGLDWFAFARPVWEGYMEECNDR